MAVTFNRAKAHVRYKKADGTRVPGTTTITGQLDKPALIPWANKLGLQGIDSRTYVDALAGVGTLAHYMVECDFNGIKPDMDEYSKKEIDLAENGYLSFLNWRSQHTISNVSCELQLVDEELGYGGTCDIHCSCDGVWTLIDLKTGKAIYPEMMIQIAAYRNLLRANGFHADDTHILRIGRSEDEGFDDVSATQLDIYFDIFKLLLKIYNLKKQVGMR